MRDPKVLVVTPTSYIRQTHRFTPHDEFGVCVAHDDFCLATLRYTSADIGYLKAELDGPISLNGATSDKLDTNSDDLIREFGEDRVRLGSLHDFEATCRNYRPVYLAGGPEMMQAAHFRMSLPPSARFPILTILHSTYWQSMLTAYTAMLLAVKPYDMYVVTSRAGEDNVRLMIERAAEHLSESLGVNAIPDPHSRVRTVRLPLGIHADSLQPVPREQAREGLCLPKDAPVLLYLGRLSEEFKADLDPLLLTAARLRERYPNLILLLAGQDKEQEYTRSLGRIAAGYGIAGNVKLIPNFPRFLKPMLYASADIFVSPVDNIQETFGLSILEAMCCGVPVIASDWSGYRDLVVHGSTGLLVPTHWDSRAADRASRVAPYLGVIDTAHFLAQRTVVDPGSLEQSLETLLANPELRRAMGQRGRERVLRDYQWSVLAKRYEEIWREQVSLLENAAETRPARYAVDVDRIYRHMAARQLPAEGHVVCHAPARCREVLAQSDRRFGSVELRSQTRRLAQSLGPLPIPLRELRSAGPQPVNSDALGWLWKRGLCGVVGATER